MDVQLTLSASAVFFLSYQRLFSYIFLFGLCAEPGTLRAYASLCANTFECGRRFLFALRLCVNQNFFRAPPFLCIPVRSCAANELFRNRATRTRPDVAGTK